MKRTGLGLAVVLILLVGGALVVPSFIDWTTYRSTFEERIASLTGRTVSIEGDVSLSILPRPALSIGQVQLGNISGAVEDYFLTAEAVDVNLALGPLFTGQFKFVSIDIINPIINAEILPDGRTTWLLEPSRESDQVPLGDQSVERGLDLAVDRLSIANGTLRYRDSNAGAAYDISGINADVSARSLDGPYALSGRALVQDAQWQYDLSVGAIRDGRPSALAVSITGPENSVVGKLNGQLTFSNNLLAGSGRLSISGSDGARVLSLFAAVDEQGSLPKPLQQSFEIASRVNFDGVSVKAEEIEIVVADAKFEGRGSLAVTDQPNFELSLRTGRLNLSPWLETGVVIPNNHRSIESLFKLQTAQAQTEDMTSEFSLPAGVSGTLDLKVDLIEWRGQVMRSGILSASLSESELTVAELSLQLPGNSSVQINGFVKEKDGRPAVDLFADVSARNLRRFLAWIDVEPDGSLVPPGRLNTLAVSSRITGTPAQLNLEDVEITLDTTTATGFASYQATGSGLAKVNLKVSQLDLDSYVPALRTRLTSQENLPEDVDVSESGDATQGEQPLSYLGEMDTNLILSVGTLTAAGNVIQGFTLNAALESGAVRVENISVENLAGARVSLQGVIREPIANIKLEDFKVSLATENLARTARALAIDIPTLPALSGLAQISGDVSGTLEDLTLLLAGQVSALTVNLDGRVRSLSSVPEFDFKTEVRHPNYSDLMSDFGIGLPDATKPLEAVRLDAVIKGNASLFSVSDLSVVIDGNAFGGTVNIEQSRGKARITGSINVQRMELDRLWPVDPAEELTRASRTRSSSGSAGVSRRWSTETFNLSSFQAMDANLVVAAKYVSGRGVELEDFVGQVNLSDGLLNVTEWRGKLYDGEAGGDIVMYFNGPLRVESRIEIQDALVDRIGGALATSSSASGRASLTGTFATRGTNQREMVSNLSGQGAFTASGLDADKAGQGTLAQVALAPVRALSQLGGLLGGGVTDGFASLGAKFNGANGVFNLSEASIKSNVYSGEFSGQIDLPRWWIESEGRVRMEANLITQLLGNRLQLPSLIPISISGSLDAPNVKMDTGSEPQAEQPAPSALPTAPSNPEQPNPLDLFQGILNELAKPQ